ncbi:MAG TPA: hypothetical protein VME69_01980 [Methylocella sp.]|nr:hypothetical protein [Methylocella sp.]
MTFTAIPLFGEDFEKNLVAPVPLYREPARWGRGRTIPMLAHFARAFPAGSAAGRTEGNGRDKAQISNVVAS